MREIKFRAWDTKKQIFVPSGDIIFSDYGDTRITVNPNCMEYIGDSCHNYNEDSRFKIMQYTGLKDKNEVEIYEGDICRCWGGSEFNGHYEYNKIYEVKWQGSGFEMMIDDCGYGWNYSSGFEYIEIIGNIYENQELLA